MKNQLHFPLSRIKAVTILSAFICLFFISKPSHAVWVWSKETGKFRNIDDVVKESAKAQFEYGEELEKQEDYAKASKSYKKLVEHFPDSILAARAQFRYGRCLEKMGRYSKAFEAYQTVIEKYPNFAEPESVLERQFAVAEMYYRGKKKELPFLGIGIFSGKSDAVKFLDQIAKNAPFSKYAEKGKFMAGVILEQMDRYEDSDAGEGAVSAYKFVIERFPDGEFADDAQFRIGISYYEIAKKARYNRKAFEASVANLQKYIALYPKGEFIAEAKAKISELDFRGAKGTYEVGRFYEKKKKIDAALIYYREVVEKFPLSEWAEQAEAKIKALSPAKPEEDTNKSQGGNK
jgi:outer membrane protein assembly factor BamD